MALSQQVYSDFSGGFNDSVAGISISDSEVCVSENADYSAEIKSFRTRAGSKNVNEESFAEALRKADGATFSVSYTSSAISDDEYKFIYSGSSWTLNGRAVSLSDFGITATGTVRNGDIITLDVPTETVKRYYCPVEVTDGHTWSIASKNKKCLVINSKLYDYDDVNQELTFKINLSSGAKFIYPFTVYNKFYFGDGSELYCWGDYDFSSEMGTATVGSGQIVRNNDNSSTGTIGHFYQALNSRGSINLKTENYSSTANWKDVTEAVGFASSVARVLTAYDPSVPEVVNITVTKGATNAGTVTIYIDGGAYTCSVAAGASVDAVVNAIKAISITGWTSVKSNNTVTFTKSTNGLTANGYVDAGETGAIITYVTQQEGKVNDCNLNPIKKCTMFVVHTSSYRVFACGNPDDNAVYYSEIGNPAYFISDYNKVYALSSYGKPTGMLQLSESVLISYENGWYAWNGITVLEDASWKPLNLPYGCASHRSIALTPYSFVYLGKDGIYNVSVSILSTEIVLLQGKDIITKITNSKVDNVINSIKNKTACTGVFHDNVYYLAYNTDTTGNNRVLKYEWDTNSFTEVTGWHVNSWIDDGNGFYFTTENYLIEAGVGENDIDTVTGEEKPIELYIKTKEYHFGNPFINKVVRLVGIIFKQNSVLNNISANVKIIMGYNSFEIKDISVAESLIWGRDWGLLWGFREAITKMIELTMSSNTFQIEIRNKALNSPITIVAIGFVYEVTDFVTPTILKDEVLQK